MSFPQFGRVKTFRFSTCPFVDNDFDDHSMRSLFNLRKSVIVMETLSRIFPGIEPQRSVIQRSVIQHGGSSADRGVPRSGWPVLILLLLPGLIGGCGFFHKTPGPQTDSPALKDSRPQPSVDAGAEFSLAPIHFERVMNSGVDFQHQTGNSAERPFPAANGSGLGAIDYDLDGVYDLYFATGRSFPLDGPDPLAMGNRLYRNLRNWTFLDVTVLAGVGHLGYSAGLAVGDFNGDGFPDIYVNCYGPNVLYQNNGDGTFHPLDEGAGVNDPRWGTSAAFLDYDGDGNLDLYVCNYAKWSLATNAFCGNHLTNTRIFCNPNSVEAEAHGLFHNEGDGTFQERSVEAGVGGGSGRGQGVIAADVDRDGLIDLYVANDLQPNFLFQNLGQGRFRDISEESGAAYDKAGQVHAGMGVDAADLNQDGLPELFVTNFEQEYNTCYDNQGQMTLLDVSEIRGLAAASRPWVGWGTALVDLDSDGLRDVIVTNGHTDANLSAMGRDSEYLQPALIWRNLGKRFAVVSETAGDYFQERFCGRALSTVDLDNDGDLDIVIGHQDQIPALLRNDGLKEVEVRKKTVTLKLIGRNSGRDAIGALVQIKSGKLATFHQVRGGGSYLSAQDPRILGVCDGAVASVTIRWPSGLESLVPDLAPGAEYVVIEPRSGAEEPYLSLQKNVKIESSRIELKSR